jgi:hypothetical protein|nr:MAG TPA: hypothetical protein [Caudoviricetes sp.]
MRKLQQLLAEVEQKLERTQLEWFRSVPDPIQPLIKGWSNTQVWALAGPQLNTLYTGPDATKPALLQDSFLHPIIYRAAYDVRGTAAAPEKAWVESAPRDAILATAKAMAANPTSSVLDFVSQHTRTHEQALLASPTTLIQMPLERVAIQAHRKGFELLSKAMTECAEKLHEEALKYCKAVDLHCSSVTGGWV